MLQRRLAMRSSKHRRLPQRTQILPTGMNLHRQGRQTPKMQKSVEYLKKGNQIPSASQTMQPALSFKPKSKKELFLMLMQMTLMKRGEMKTIHSLHPHLLLTPLDRRRLITFFYKTWRDRASSLQHLIELRGHSMERWIGVQETN